MNEVENIAIENDYTGHVLGEGTSFKEAWADAIECVREDYRLVGEEPPLGVDIKEMLIEQGYGSMFVDT